MAPSVSIDVYVPDMGRPSGSTTTDVRPPAPRLHFGGVNGGCFYS